LGLPGVSGSCLVVLVAAAAVAEQMGKGRQLWTPPSLRTASRLDVMTGGPAKINCLLIHVTKRLIRGECCSFRY
jgi:hypothetical protein